MKLLNRADLEERGIKYSPSQLFRKMKDGSFPPAVKGTGKENHWVDTEIDEYLQAQFAARAPRRPIPAAGTGRGV